jgi:hypothetical protein
LVLLKAEIPIMEWCHWLLTKIIIISWLSSLKTLEFVSWSGYLLVTTFYLMIFEFCFVRIQASVLCWN